MIIPQIGDWACCQGFDLGSGKVTKINYDRNEFSADFLTEPFYNNRGDTEEVICSFSQIERIISDPAEIKGLKEKRKGNI